MWGDLMLVSGKARIAGTVVCFLIPGAACATNQLPAHDGKPIIDFNGDSITFQSTADINAQFGTTYDVGINATTGITAKDQWPGVAKQAKDDPAIEVINLGTNDASDSAHGSGETVHQANAALDAYNAEFPNSCVVFVTIDSHNPSWGPAFAAALNYHIRATFAHVADWGTAYDPSYFDGSDTPHPNETGRQALLALEDAAITGCTPAS
jgi:hypothetical protein